MKKVILIITGSIAAPKALELYNLLKQSYEVTVLVTPSAKKFVRFPENIKVHDDFLDQEFYQREDKINHIEFAYSHDLIVVYPATMTFISKAALAICDNLPLATFFASKANKIIFPAMNHNMYHNQAMQRNLALLAQDASVSVTQPDYGLLATRISGDGRLKEPDVAFKMIQEFIKESTELTNKTVLINYGATRSYLDDMRYLTNNSSGKMGQALAQAFLAKNAKVIAVVGDVSIPLIKDPNLTIIRANTNQTVFAGMNKYFAQADIVVCVAALNDYQIAEQWKGKISKSQNETLKLNLIANLDVLASLGAQKTKQLLIGFSAQDSQDAIIAKEKMIKKNCDGIVMNNISVMNQEQTEVEFYFKNNSYQFKGSKIEVAKEIVQILSKNLVK
ncbi:bifunctional phosphopantothenoylcysteine decarboxylase/phosphopantothenate--cysteine ligase CoaBC [Spiroplasma platyhelix]|uniref:Coenzyme A biosynthesis bifunctional protein CoaBC n=1 Tax=Spiroplasma platyhelix PALS-1 TaxID=1276218 RepID=A0A846U1L0_9MOLU|nr:bifunctional phosphopantothenoylcysteine decarboxylase/phosphopantothenate--cysteine ligase CoaBC [Spiroplasma platyhelix]MBE4704028.1 Coenzyme A biosynthesis bifunctional protein CoaBC [Spiroplasma platyhelix PALS-1]NKE38399.1 bifunctional phosphopantothenoylcysteine decarboxylase/phosphopantothenate--cysteine ligase CoaBC [Spiroplasma platyhelix PALS-1]UJB29286.1 phosphopantothenoylcysteine decarboxylase [Spiroplasma platyhelix PALS-1]